MESFPSWRRFARRDPTPRRGAFTKIVATLGPASESRIGELIDAGMDVARINFSHGTHEEHRTRVETLRREAERRGVAVGVLADIRGPKLRLGSLPGGEVRLAEGATVELVEGAGPETPPRIPLDVEGVLERLQEGERVLLADGAVELAVTGRRGDAVVGRVARGGRIATRKGVHFPDTEIPGGVPTEKDREDLAFSKELEVDFCGISFVSGPEEVEAVRHLLPDAWMVAKIERVRAVENVEAILEAADGIMVARGDLGVELDMERLPAVQRALLNAARTRGRFTITATEMLESMVVASRPTRAEVSDVAHAILDGTDAVMLSAETAVGADPVAAVRTMNRIALSVETSQRDHELPRPEVRSSEPTFANAIARAASDAVEILEVARVVCFTETGATPRLLSLYRPPAEILALSPHPPTLRRVSLLAHVRPVAFGRYESLEDMLEAASDYLVETGRVRVGDSVVFVAGVPPGVARSTNVLKLHTIGDPIKLA